MLPVSFFSAKKITYWVLFKTYSICVTSSNSYIVDNNFCIFLRYLYMQNIVHIDKKLDLVVLDLHQRMLMFPQIP